MAHLAHIPRLRDWIIGFAASAILIAGSATGALPFSMTETLGFVTGAAAVWLLVRESIWNWPAGIANAAFYLVVFAHARFFADSALQVLYIVLGAFGWWWWLRGRGGRPSRPIAGIGVAEGAIVAALTCAAAYGMLLYLRSVSDAAPLADATTTALSLAATWMQARKQIENWLVWIAADVIYIPLYFVKGLPLTGVLYSVFALMCVKGWRDWARARAAEESRRWGHGAVIGKFLPFHAGHRHLIETARSRTDELTVIVVARAAEPIRGELRARWIQEACPDVTVVLLDQEATGLDSADTDGWAAVTIRVLGRAPDVVFSSEPYGEPWAEAMGCDHVLVDRRRRTVPVSGTGIRRNPLANLGYLRGGARGHYVKRVLLLGAESTGKTTLARALADHYDTVWNPEVGHVYTWFRPEGAESWRSGEFALIARLQNWYEDFLAEQANRVLFCDTSAWTTGLFEEVYLGERSAEVNAVSGRPYDLTIVCDVETPFQQDERGMRTDGPHRRRMHEAYLEHLEEAGAPYLLVSGPHRERMRVATAAVDALLAATPRSHGRVRRWLTISPGVALVTGGGRGIGLNVARELAAAGARVAVSGRTVEQVENAAREIGGIPVVGDVSVESDADRMVAETERAFGAIDLLVANAGIAGNDDTVADSNPHEWWRVFEVNVFGTYLTCRAVLPSMLARGEGRIVIVGSGASYLPVRGSGLGANYGASKAAVGRFAEYLAAESGTRGVSVFLISPGLVQTDMTLPDSNESTPWTPPELAPQLIRVLASGRADRLAGRYIHAEHDDIEELIGRADEIVSEDLNAIRIRR